MTKLAHAFSAAMIALSIDSCLAQDLVEIYQLAVQNDPTTRSADINQSAIAEIKSQSIAQMLPNMAFSATSSRTRSDNTSRFFGKTLQHYQDNKLGVTLRQPVFNWGHWIQLGQADNKVAQSEADFQAKRQQLITRTVEAYFNILAAQDGLQFSAAEKQAIDKQLEQAKQRFEVGIIAITDVYEAQAGYDRAQASEIEAQNKLDNSKEALREILGDTSAELAPLQAEIPLSNPQPSDIAAWSNSAESNNFAIVSQLNLAEYVRKNVELQQSKHLPTLDIIAAYNQLDSSGNRFGSLGDNESVGLQLNMPLFEGGGTLSRSRQAAFEYEMAKEDLIKVKRSVNRQVKDAFRGVNTSVSKVKALQANVQSAQQALEAAEAGFEVGTRTMVDVLQVQRDLYKAKSDHARSRYDYLINGIKLKEAAGSLGEADIQDINQFLSHP